MPIGGTSADLSKPLPLLGLRILTVESFGAGPYGSMFLADLGAEVIKLEDPTAGGDASRGVGPHYLGDGNDSQYFQTFNRNKRSIAVDLKTPEGRQILKDLAAKSDAVLNNLRGDLPQQLGLDYATLQFVNPKIVCAHLSAYGRNNERATRPGYDYLMQAEAGFMSLTGEPDGPPTRFGLSVVDFITGLTAALGLLSAVLGARESRVGCDIDTCLFDVALHQLSYPATWYLNEGTVTERLPRGAHPSVAPTQLYRTQDGWIMLMCMKERFWQRLVEAIGRPELRDDPRFAEARKRHRNRDALTVELDAALSTATTADWVEKLKDLLPCAPVLDLPGALDNPFVKATGMVENVPHPARRDFRMLANPLRINGKRLPGRSCAQLGGDTRALLAQLGYPREKVEELHARGVVRAPAPPAEESGTE
jgi:crotonobetainyl-CoA:carnitine CoA-transferase CaiB-like acyl-CoA transferase